MLNALALWIMGSEIGKDIFRFGETPDVTSTKGIVAHLKSMVVFEWLPDEGVHITLQSKLMFSGFNAGFFGLLAYVYFKGKRVAAVAVGSLPLLNTLLIFSPAVGTL